MFDFIWKQKPAKIKETTLIKKKADGRLGMKDFALFDKTQTNLGKTAVLRLRRTVEVNSKIVPLYCYCTGDSQQQMSGMDGWMDG